MKLFSREWNFPLAHHETDLVVDDEVSFILARNAFPWVRKAIGISSTIEAGHRRLI